MRLIDVGTGPPLVLIPGIQGRWEYLQRAIDALARRFRVLTFPLSGEPGTPRGFDPSLGFDDDAQQVLAVLDRHGISRAVICGISYGGLPAIHFAATHPNRTRALVLVSTPAAQWQLRPRHRVYARVPWLFAPLFFMESPFRLRKELRTAMPSRSVRWRFAGQQLHALLRAPLSPSRMAARAVFIADTDIVADCARVAAPTLIVTGEPTLDRVVSVEGTLAYLNLIPRAQHVTLPATGHLGSITRPEVFLAAVDEFVSGLRDQLADGSSPGEQNDAA